MEGFTYPGMAPSMANPWNFLQQPGGDQQQPQQQQPQRPQQQGQFLPGSLMASLGMPASAAAAEMPLLPGLAPPQHQLQPQQHQQQAGGGGWNSMQNSMQNSMHNFQLPANFLPSGLGLPDGGGSGNGAGIFPPGMQPGMPAMSAAAASHLGRSPSPHLPYGLMAGGQGFGQQPPGAQAMQQAALLHAQRGYGGAHQPQARL